MISMKNVLIFLGVAIILGATFFVYFNWLHNQTRPLAAPAHAQAPFLHTLAPG